MAREHVLRTEQRVARPLAEVFACFAQSDNLGLITRRTVAALLS